MNLQVVKALVIKYLLVCSRNSARALDIFFWPIMDLLVWGFLTTYLLSVTNNQSSLITFLISAIIFWNVLYRSQLVFSVLFLDDLYARNLANIFAAPIRKLEYMAAAFTIAAAQAIIVVCLMGALCLVFYSYNFFLLGMACVLFFINLLFMGCSLGVIATSCILRWGQPAETLPWVFPFLLQPLSAVFYPVSALPNWLQPIALLLPSSHVFEGMRESLSTGHLNEHHLIAAIALNIVYMTIALLIFHASFEAARNKGFFAKYAS